ncbi:MAG: DUF3995 domain-containing protein [Chloroflexia bacterium]
MIGAIGLLASGVLAALGLLHLYWAFGRRSPGTAFIPEVAGQPTFVPTTSATVVVAALLFIASTLLLGRVCGWGEPALGRVFTWGTCGVAVAFFLRAIGDFRLVGFFKRVRGTAFARWDSRLLSPLCLGLAIAALAVVVR